MEIKEENSSVNDKFKNIFSKKNFENIKTKIKKTQKAFWKKNFSFQYYENWSLKIWTRYSKNVDTLREELNIEWITQIQNIVEKKSKDSLIDIDAIENYISKPSSSDMKSLVASISTLLRWWASTSEAIKESIDNVDNKVLKKIMKKVLWKSRVSSDLYKAFEWFPDIFDKNFIFMIKAWDKSWDYSKAFTELAEQIKMEDDINKLKREASMEPLKNIFVLSLALYVIIWKVVPWISWMFESSWQALPLPTEILIVVMHFFQDYWTMAIIWIIVFWIMLRSLLTNEVSKWVIDRFTLKIPIIREKTKFENFYNMANTFDILWRSWWESTISCLKDLYANTKHIVFKESLQEWIKWSLKWKEFPLWEMAESNKYLWKTKDYILYPMIKNWEKNSDLDLVLSREKMEIFYMYREYVEKYIRLVKFIFWTAIKMIIIFIVFALFLPLISYDPNSDWSDPDEYAINSNIQAIETNKKIV